jgi:hypothetical protein
MSGLLIVAACLFGGGSRAGFLGDVVIQLLAVPLFVLGLPRWCARIAADVRAHSPDVLLHMATLLFIALLFLQLLPWAVRLDEAAGAPLTADGAAAAHWYAFSATPASSWAAAMSMIPVFAIVFGASQMQEQARRMLAALVIAMGALALLVGFIQVLQGPESGLRFFEFTNATEAVGFFANRNHFAAQLYITLVFAGIWFASSAGALLGGKKVNSYAILWVVASAILVVALLAGVTVARSRAGVILAVIAMVGIAGIFAEGGHKSRGRRDNNSRRIRRWVLSGLALGVVFAAQFGVHHVLTRFEADPLDDYRLILSPATFELALSNLPFGTGLGSFPTVYGVGEKLEHLFSGYANRAHNDWAEYLLEGGIFSVTICGLFLAWLVMSARRAWQQDEVKRRSSLYRMLQCGAAIIMVLVLGHSLVDYPLRTTAISVLFAFSCAMMLPDLGLETSRIV